MTPRRVTPETIETLAFDHTVCCGAELEFAGDDAHLTLTDKHGGLFVAAVPVEVTA